MSGIFLSYSRSDHALADQITRGLRVVGVDVWWDEDMHGVDWQEELERQLSELVCVVVLWTPNSANSRNVRDEARLGLESDKLVNILAGVPKPPFPFDRIQGLSVDGWTGHEPHRRWTLLVQTIEAKVVEAGGAQPGDITGALARHEQELRLKQQALDQAQAAFQDAQGREAEASEAAEAASGALDRAEVQLRRVVEIGVTSGILQMAQKEMDASRAAKEEAGRAHKAAKAELSEASRALSRARADMEGPSEDNAAPPPSGLATKAKPAKDKGPFPQKKPAPFSEPAKRAEEAGSGRTTISKPAIIGAGLAGAALLVGGAAVLFGHPAPPPPSPPPAPPVSNATGPSSAVAAAGQAAAALRGKWRLKGLTCDDPEIIAVEDDVLWLGATSKAKIQPSDQPGVIKTQADDGAYTYRLEGKDAEGMDTLSVVGPGGMSMTLTKCSNG